MSYSNSGGGTLSLASPTHVHHVDVSSAVRSLRRSLSRSPSKFRIITSRSGSLSPRSPLSPSPLSPPPRALSQPTTTPATPSHTPSPLAKPFPPSVKLSLRSAIRSKTAPPRASSRTRTSPRSPTRRVLTTSSDSGNSVCRTSQESAPGQENGRGGSLSPTERRSLEKTHGDKAMPYFEITAPINQALARLGDENSVISAAGTSSPLKRSDAIMNLDQASLGSPVAKRRSLHGSGSFGNDFNVFDHAPSSTSQFDIHEDSSSEYEISAIPFTAGNSLAPNLGVMPRRSSSLRKSTLQQRHGEKQTSWGRKHAAQLELAKLASTDNVSEISTPVRNKDRPRLSLDQFLPPMPRDSPFSNQGILPNPSVHMFQQPSGHQPHPLSRAMTTSSSNSSLAEDSPTHVPVFLGKQPRPRLDFSKSLPPGSLRPQAVDTLARQEGASFATPENYKTVKPLPAAFMSTGLISKVNRFPEMAEQNLGGKSQMPDTPCKKPANNFATYPQPIPGSAIAKARHVRHSFGTPSTPFNLHANQRTHHTFGKGPIFGSSFDHNQPSRRDSFISNDGEDNDYLPDGCADSQFCLDDEIPPTPTKQATLPAKDGKHDTHRPYSLRNMPLSISAVSRPKMTRKCSKLKISISHDDRDADDSDVSLELNDSPTTATFRSPHSTASLPSFRRSRALRRSSMYSPISLMETSSTTSPLSPSETKGPAKINCFASASPLEHLDSVEGVSPRTPHESGSHFPDPSNLSISNRKESARIHNALNAGSMLPPATPTTGRDYFAQVDAKRLSMTPINASFAPEADSALTSRFEKVELIGTGEFSQVYRVSQSSVLHNHVYTFFGGSTSSVSPAASLPDRVFAVKKARQPFQGTRDRLRKLQEVQVLRALGQSDHVVHYIDSWEQLDHLYIQTEFCEEGSLDLFLSQVGRKGRLDDFRIWKIMLEIGQGIKHIHDSGYIHLDLKPANILITFEGVLKIADFGMATSWPAQPGIEGEGDREYIGPEILLGKYDKPSDVFALGLIMLEIAGNVQLPDNGPTWQRLRSGDMSDVPSLTWSTASTVIRDATGIPMEDSDTSMDTTCSDDESDADFCSPVARKRHSMPALSSPAHKSANLFGNMRHGELHSAPDFMRDQHHEYALDHVVRWMLSPAPEDRPSIHNVLNCEGLQWVDNRRRAGATVFEGNWGPADNVLADDAEMMDV